jgi:hypothetical protein
VVDAERQRIRQAHRLDALLRRQVVEDPAMKVTRAGLIVAFKPQVDSPGYRPGRIEADIDRHGPSKAEDYEQRTDQENRRQGHLHANDQIAQMPTRS